VADRFDIVAVGIEDVGPVVDRMVLGAKPRPSVVASVRRDGRLVEGIHGGAIAGGDGDVDGGGHTFSDPEVRLARPPEPRSGDVVLNDQLVAERGQSFGVNAFAPLAVRHRNTNLIEHRSPPMTCETEPTFGRLSISVTYSLASVNFRERRFYLSSN
jgi:hypothetical protein